MMISGVVHIYPALTIMNYFNSKQYQVVIYKFR